MRKSADYFAWRMKTTHRDYFSWGANTIGACPVEYLHESDDDELEDWQALLWMLEASHRVDI